MFFLPDTTQGVSCLLLPCPLHRLVLQLTHAHSAVCWFNLNSVRTIDSTFSKMFLLFFMELLPMIFISTLEATNVYFYLFVPVEQIQIACFSMNFNNFLWILPLMVTLDISIDFNFFFSLKCVRICVGGLWWCIVGDDKICSNAKSAAGGTLKDPLFFHY